VSCTGLHLISFMDPNPYRPLNSRCRIVHADQADLHTSILVVQTPPCPHVARIDGHRPQDTSQNIQNTGHQHKSRITSCKTQGTRHKIPVKRYKTLDTRHKSHVTSYKTQGTNTSHRAQDKSHRKGQHAAQDCQKITQSSYVMAQRNTRQDT
jgi:hypothetical protein